MHSNTLLHGLHHQLRRQIQSEAVLDHCKQVAVHNGLAVVQGCGLRDCAAYSYLSFLVQAHLQLDMEKVCPDCGISRIIDSVYVVYSANGDKCKVGVVYIYLGTSSGVDMQNPSLPCVATVLD
jgi:hypothetical protein